MKVYLKTMFVVLLILGLGYFLTIQQWSVAEPNILEIFFNAFGTIYAIVVGFIIFLVLSYYNQLKGYINAETNALQDLRDFLVFIDGQDEVVREIHQKINAYVESVIQKEWPNMVSHEKTNMDTSPELYDLMHHINKINPVNQSDVVALEKLIGSVSEITTHRSNRLMASEDRLPPLLKQLVILLSAFIVIGFTLVPIQDTFIRILLTTAITFATTLIYFVILDLDSAFKGAWAVTSARYEEILRENKNHLISLGVAPASQEGEASTSTPKKSVTVAFKRFFQKLAEFILLLSFIGGGAWFWNYQQVSDSSLEARKKLERVAATFPYLISAKELDVKKIEAFRESLNQNIQEEGGLSGIEFFIPQTMYDSCLENKFTSLFLLAVLSFVEGNSTRAQKEFEKYEQELKFQNLEDQIRAVLSKPTAEALDLLKRSLEKVKKDPKSAKMLQEQFKAHLLSVPVELK